MSLRTNPQHYYIATALLTYTRPQGEEDQIMKQRHMNVVLELPRKVITASTLDNARVAVLQRLMDENQVPSDQVHDVVFLGFSYLGNIRPDDFYDLKAPSNSTKN